MNRLRCAFALLLTGLWGCADDRTAEGPGSETSGLSARILDSAGAPLAGVAVRVVPVNESWHSALSSGKPMVLAEQLTDAQGRVRFELPTPAPVMMELDDTLHAGRQWVVPGSDTVRELRATSACRLRVAATVPGETIHELRLAGTGYPGLPQPDGTWLFRGAPRGTYAVAARTDSGLALLGRVRLVGGTLDTALASDADSVLLEDFAGTGTPLTHNRYGTLLGAGWWYAVADAMNGGVSITTPSNVQDALIPCAAGTCLDMGFTLDPANSGHYALVGMAPDGSKDPQGGPDLLADFTKVTRIRFLASGSGAFWFQLGVTRTSGGVATCHSSFNIGPTLAETEVTMTSLVCDASDPDFRLVQAMTWSAIQDGHLTLGRIRLIGTGPRGVFRSLRKP